MATIPFTPADSLLASAAILRAAGRDFDAAFTQDLAADAAAMPGLYAWHAKQQALRAGRFARPSAKVRCEVGS